MNQLRFSRNLSVLIAVAVVVFLGNAWYALDTWEERVAVQSLETDLATQRQNLSRLRSTSQITAARQELADLQAKAPSSIRQPLPTSADTLRIVSDLFNVQPTPGKLVAFKAKDPRIDTIDGNQVQVFGYQLNLRGNSGELLVLLRRVDESSLVSLRIASLTLENQADGWAMAADLTLGLALQSQPTPN